MPAGKSRTGRNKPTMPGSSKPAEERTSTGAGISKGELARTAARMRSQLRSNASAIAANPNTHTPQIARGTQCMVPCAGGTNDAVPVNGWVTCTIASETVSGEIVFVAGAHVSSLPPRLSSSENGTKNLNDALNHSQ